MLDVDSSNEEEEEELLLSIRPKAVPATGLGSREHGLLVLYTHLLSVKTKETMLKRVEEKRMAWKKKTQRLAAANLQINEANKPLKNLVRKADKKHDPAEGISPKYKEHARVELNKAEAEKAMQQSKTVYHFQRKMQQDFQDEAEEAALAPFRQHLIVIKHCV